MLSHAGEHIAELIAEFSRERDDHGLRCWLLELIGEVRFPLALPILVLQLYGNRTRDATPPTPGPATSVGVNVKNRNSSSR